MHISSLPSPYGIGTLGQAAYDFADFLKAAGQHYWQLLPIGPTSYGDSPYQSFSTHAGNPYFIDLDLLREDGLLKQEEIDAVDWEAHSARVDYGFQYSVRFDLLYRAFLRGWERDADAVREFRNANPWVEDYALYMALKRSQDMRSWETWPEEIRLRRPGAAETYAVRLGDDVHFFIYLQYLFFGQWDALRSYVHALGLEIIGDLPIYVPYDSCDVWANPSLFQLDETGLPTGVAGCPPDYFSADGQLWGNPLYNWAWHEHTQYAWWIKRVRFALELYDAVRIDHFRGFDTYYAIPYGAPNARKGEWRQGPGMRLWREVLRAVPGAGIVAEDLGEIFESVRALRNETGFPGMKVLQFAFGAGPGNDHLPHNYTENCVAYPGTHDNTTLLDWWRTARAKEKRHARAYLGLSAEEGETAGLLRGVLQSPARLAVVPMADWLGLGKAGRINTPGTIGGSNWRWRCEADALTPKLARHIRTVCERYGRA